MRNRGRSSGRNCPSTLTCKASKGTIPEHAVGNDHQLVELLGEVGMGVFQDEIEDIAAGLLPLAVFQFLDRYFVIRPGHCPCLRSMVVTSVVKLGRRAELP